MSSIKILVTRPEYDVVTSYLSFWAMDIILKANEKGLGCKDLGAEHVTRIELEKALGVNPLYVLFNGHGDSDTIFGHKDEPIIIADENDDLLKDKIVHAIACSAAASLGPSMIDKGAQAFIGYAEKFAFLTDTNTECVPERDKLAKYFMDASNEISYSLIKGNNTGDAFKKSQSKYKEFIRKLSSSKAFLEAAEVRFWLFWNMQNQVMLGNAEASI